MLSEAIYPFEKEPEGEGVVLSEQARAIIEATQDPSTVLGNLRPSVYPSAWSGSVANIIAKRGQAFKPLLEHSRIRCPRWQLQHKSLGLGSGKTESDSKSELKTSKREQPEQRFE